MGISTEKRLQKIEDELKALKATYTISGGLMKLYESVSPKYSFVYTEPTPIIKFQADYVTDSILLVASVNVIEDLYGGGSQNMSAYTTTHVQTGDGSILIYPAWMMITDAIQVKVVSTSPGTFTRIQ